MGLFIIKFILTNIIFSLITGFALVRLNTPSTLKRFVKLNWFNGAGEKVANLELMLYSLGLGPIFTVLILYYLLLILHGLPNIFYLAAVIFIYLFLLYWGRKTIPLLLRELREKFQTAWMAGKKKRRQIIVYFGFLLVLSIVFVYLFGDIILRVPIGDHDTLVHGNIGKMYYLEKAVKYTDNMYNTIDGFFFIGSPKPSFSLILTWEMIMNRGFAGSNDLTFDIYFRSISVYYGFLIIMIIFYRLYRRNRYLALLGILVLFSSLKFFQLFINYHLDSYRLFFLILSWIFLVYSLKNKEPLAFLLFGVFTGFTAFTHLIGLLVALVNILAFFLFQEAQFKERLIKSLVLSIIVLCFGGIHYVLEVLWGARFGFLTYF